MRKIILDGPDYGTVDIQMTEGPLPSIFVFVHDPRLTAPPRKHFIAEKDLHRLERAIKKCREKSKAYKDKALRKDK